MAERKILITGAFGLAATVYIKKFSITAYGEYSYGYGNSDWWGETLSNVLQMQRTLITIGMKSPVPLSKVGSMGLH